MSGDGLKACLNPECSGKPGVVHHLTVGWPFLGADIWWEGHKPEKIAEVV